MAFTKFAAAATLAGFVLATASSHSKAASTDYTLTMQPLHGISFDVGTKRAASYFLSADGQCRLVLTLADQPDWEQFASFTTTRFEATLPANKTIRFASPENKMLEFACLPNAQSMSVRPIDFFAARACSPKGPANGTRAAPIA